MRTVLRVLGALALGALSGCAHVMPAVASQLQSFGAAVTFSAGASPTGRDAVHAATGPAVCVSERCVYARSRRPRAHPMRIQLSFYSPSLTDDPTRRR